jgi:hypothetical protein
MTGAVWIRLQNVGIAPASIRFRSPILFCVPSENLR